jgi:hypothetical protein
MLLPILSKRETHLNSDLNNKILFWNASNLIFKKKNICHSQNMSNYIAINQSGSSVY